MNTIGDYSYRKVTRFASVVALAVVTLVATGFAPVTASAQYRGDYRYNQNRTFNRSDIQRIATVNGYAEGYEEGVEDRREHNRAGYTASEVYRSARAGYEGNWRLEREYQSWFRQGFARGYQDGYYGRSRSRTYDRSRYPNYYGGNYGGNYGGGGYNQYPGYGNYPNYDNREGDLDREDVAQRAAQNGYYAGYQRGVYDAQQRNRPNPQGNGAYQYGLDGFNPEWGSSSTYQQFYRQYFIAGYNDGHSRRARSFSYRRY